MPKPTKNLEITNGDVVQLSFYYRVEGIVHKFSLCYSFVLEEPGLNIQDRVLVESLSTIFLKNCLMGFFAEDTTFFEMELMLFTGNDPYYREKFGIRPPIEGVANRDNQVAYCGTYVAQFRRQQGDMPTAQLGRLRLVDFVVPRTLPDPEMILENKLFQCELELAPKGLTPFFLKFYGITKNRYIDLSSQGVYVEERVVRI